MGETVGYLGTHPLKKYIPHYSTEDQLHEQLKIFNDIDNQKSLLAKAVRALSKTRDMFLAVAHPGRN